MSVETKRDGCENLLLYALGKLEPELQQKFEMHLMECDDCFEDLKALERTGDVLHRMVEEQPPELSQTLNLLRRQRTLSAWLIALLILASTIGGFLLGRYVFPT